MLPVCTNRNCTVCPQLTFTMSLFDNRYERAAQVLIEAEDEVLQSAGLMALMRLETLSRRLRGQPTKKALTPPQLTTTIFPTPWWHKQATPGFSFGYHPQQNQSLFGGAPQTSLFGSNNAVFGSSQPPNATGFSASQPQSQGGCFGSSQPSSFASQPQSQNTGFGSTQSTNPTAFGAPPSQSQNTGFGSTQSTNSAAFGAPPSQSQSFGSPQPTQITGFGASQPQSQSAFGSTSQTNNATAFGTSQSPQPTVGLFGMPSTGSPTFGNQQPQSTPLNVNFGFTEAGFKLEPQAKGAPTEFVASTLGALSLSQAKGEPTKSVVSTLGALSLSNTSQSAVQVKSEEGAASKTTDAENSLGGNKDLKTLTKPVAPKSFERLPKIDLLTLKDEGEKINVKPAAVKSLDKELTVYFSKIQNERTKSAAKSVEARDLSVANIKKEKDSGSVKSSTMSEVEALFDALIKKEKSLSKDYQKHKEKSYEDEKSLVSLERKVEQIKLSQHDSLKSLPRYYQSQNFTKLDAPSYTFDYTQVYQPQSYHFSNTLVNVNSISRPLPRSSGGCGCRQIQCGDRRCGCRKSGAMCGSGCLCASRGSWCLNR